MSLTLFYQCSKIDEFMFISRILVHQTLVGSNKCDWRRLIACFSLLTEETTVKLHSNLPCCLSLKGGRIVILYVAY